ncbi:MAG TPA: hypothetical protein DDW55_08190 [Gammaproteobacteria bacterium]|nr:hypothetical protein [Gammaproteobacteria bacterium]
MKLHLQQTGTSNVIRACERSMVKINDAVCTSSLIVTPDKLDPDWGITHASQLELEHLEQLLDYQPDIILLGTGNKHLLLEPRMMMSIMQKGIGIEVMTTDAACRTYNVLLGEDRAVLAALIIEENEA